MRIGRGTIRRILKDHLIEPAPTRGRRISWSVFLKTHWRTIAASDFFSVEVWGLQGLVTHYVLFVIELATRRVVICGTTTNPNEAWMLQAARNLLDMESGILQGKRHLIVDRDTKYSAAFRTFLAREGTEVIRLPPRSPNLNAWRRSSPSVHRCSAAHCGNTWDTTILSEIIKASITNWSHQRPCDNHGPSAFRAERDWAACFASTKEPQPEHI